jgi:hypothetical protein
MRAARFDRLMLAFFGFAVLYGCANLLPDYRWEREVGAIEIGLAQPAPIRLPETVQRGVPFVATVATFGSGTCTRPDGAEVHVSGLIAEVTPYDLKATRGACTDDLVPYPREVSLRFDQAGEALVRVLGRTLRSEPAQYEARLVVRP